LGTLSPSAQQPGGNVTTIDGYSVELPAHLAVERKPGPDFLVTLFNRNDTQLLGAYSGNHPSVDAPPHTAKRRTLKINGKEAAYVTHRDSTGRHCGEMLVALRYDERLKFGFYVHFFYCVATQSDVQTVERIMFSVKATEF
jgi:hypothetical protein